MTGRIVVALLRLQWLLAKNRLKKSAHRDALEHASRWGEVAVVVVLVLLLVPAAIGLAVAAAIGGWSAAHSAEALRNVAMACGFVLVMPLFWMLLRPLALMTHGGSERMLMLRLLPIPTALLRNVEIVRAAVDPMILLFVPALLLLPIGILAAGRPLLAILLLGSGVVYIALVAFVGSLVTLAVQLLLRGRRRAEIVTFVLLAVLSMAGILPQLFVPPHQRGRAGRTPPAAKSAPARPSPHLPAGVRAVPPAAYAMALFDGAEGRWPAAGLDLAILLAFAVATYGLSVPVYRRLTTTPEPAGNRKAGAARLSRRLVLPSVAPATSAVAHAEVRALMRTVRGKMAVFYPALMTLLFAAILSRPGGGRGALHFGPILLGAMAAFVAVSNGGAFSCNQFAVQGRGLILELLLPLRERTLAAGKLIAVGMLVALSLFLALIAPAIFFRTAPFALWIALWLAGIATYAAAAPVAVALSALFPKMVDLSRAGRAAQPNVASSLIYMLASVVAASPAAAAIVVGLRVLDRPWVAPALVLVYLVAAVALARALLGVAARIVEARLENLAFVVTGR